MKNDEKKYDLVKQFFLYLVSPPVQLFLIVLSSFLIITLAYGPIRKFYSAEASSQLLPITPQLVKKWGGEPIMVTVGLHIRNFPEFDFVSNKFEFDGILWFEFDPALISLETISKFTFDKADLIKKSEPYTKLIDDKFFARFDIRVRFNMTLDYQFFPFDDHRMFITLINRFVPPNEVMFRSGEIDFSIADEVKISGWEIEDREVRVGYAQDYLEAHEPQKTVLYPKIVFSIDFRRSGIRYILLIILPIIIIFFMGLYSFAFDPQKQSAMITGLAIGGITSLLSYRFVVERLTPQVGYFVLSDYIFTILLFFALIEVLLGLAIVNFGKLNKFFIIVRGILFLSFHIIFFCTWYYFLRQLW